MTVRVEPSRLDDVARALARHRSVRCLAALLDDNSLFCEVITSSAAELHRFILTTLSQLDGVQGWNASMELVFLKRGGVETPWWRGQLGHDGVLVRWTAGPRSTGMDSGPPGRQTRGVDRLRPWALWLALVAALLATLVCVGSSLLTSPPPLGERVAALHRTPPPDGVDADDVADLDAGDFDADVADPPGLGIPTLALANGLLLVTVGLAALSTVVGNRVTGSVQGVVSILAGLAAIVLGVVAALGALAAVLLMVSLLLSTPFGTLAYLALFGFFDTGTSLAALALLLALQIAAAVLLVVAQQRFLKSKGLVLLILTVLLLTVVTTLLHSLVPGVLVSITDAVAAIVAGVVAAIWGVAMLVGGIVSVVKLVVAARQSRARDLTRPA